MDLKGVDPYNILSTLSCVNDKITESCNTFSPLEQYKLYGKNPATNKTFTEQQRGNKRTEFNNKCGLTNDKVVHCCSADDTNLGSMANFVKMDSMKDKQIRRDDKGNYFVCAEDTNDPNCRIPTGYDLCKLSSPEMKLTTLDNKEQTVSGVTPDCLKGVCANVHDLGYLEDEQMKQFYTLQDSEVLNAIQKNSVEQIKDILKDQKRISSPLKVGYEGNTMLHHAILNDANDITLLLLARKVPLDAKNRDGNTPLHLAALKGNSSILHQMIQIGGDAEIKNNIGDTVLLSAIRSADYPSVHVVIQLASATPISRNKLGETPLHVALISPQKNVDIVRLLVNKGVGLYEKNNNGHTALKTLELQRRTKENEEIRTYLINVIIKKEGKNFIKKVKKYPELANFQVVNKDGKPIKFSYLEGLEGVEVSLPDQYLPDNLQFTETKDFKYKELTDEEKMKGNETNPLNDVNYFDRGAPDNAVESIGSTMYTIGSNKAGNKQQDHTHFSKENRDVLNRLIREADKEPDTNNSIMGKIKKTIKDTGYTPYRNSSDTGNNKKNNKVKKTEKELAELKAKVDMAKKQEEDRLVDLEEQKKKLLEALENEENKGTLAKLFGGNNIANIQVQLNVINQTITNSTTTLTNIQNIQYAEGDIIKDSVIAGGDVITTVVDEGAIVSGGNVIVQGDGAVMATDGSAIAIAINQSIDQSGNTIMGDDLSTTIGDITTINDASTTVFDASTNMDDVNTTNTETQPSTESTVESFTIIPKAQNRFYLFALVVLILFILIALLSAKKLI